MKDATQQFRKSFSHLLKRRLQPDQMVRLYDECNTNQKITLITKALPYFMPRLQTQTIQIQDEGGEVLPLQVVIRDNKQD
jgi:hypothetical protein